MNDKDHYRALNIEPTADAAAIKAAFRRLALRHHPDRTGATRPSQRFLDIREAYDVLSNPERRHEYDHAYRARRSAKRRRTRVERIGRTRAPRTSRLSLDALGLRLDVTIQTGTLSSEPAPPPRRPKQPPRTSS